MVSACIAAALCCSVSAKGAVAAHRFDRPWTTEMDDTRESGPAPRSLAHRGRCDSGDPMGRAIELDAEEAPRDGVVPLSLPRVSAALRSAAHLVAA